MDWEFEFSRCRLLHIEWINSKVLLYSTGNYTQYPEINHNGKEYKKGCVYIYIYIYIIYIYIYNIYILAASLCYTAEINTL